MTQPLALLVYGTQLVNRLQDLGWRVQTLHNGSALARLAEEQKPMLVLADLMPSCGSVCEGLSGLRKNDNTTHIPVIAFSADESLHAAAAAAGANLVVSDTAVLQHLDQFIDQALTDF